jgi:hypothetical protein
VWIAKQLVYPMVVIKVEDMMGREDFYGNDPMQGKVMIQMSF